MKVSTRGTTCRTHDTNKLTLLDVLSIFDSEFTQVSVASHPTVAVGDVDMVAVSIATRNDSNGSASRSEDG